MILSYIWWVLEPLLFVALFYFVFEVMLDRGRGDFLIFLILGKIPFLWFSKSITTAANSLVENKGLIDQRPIPKFIFPLVNIQEAAYQQVVTFAVMIAVVIFSGYQDYQYWWQLVPLILLQYLLICGFGSLMAMMVTFLPDFRMILQMFMMGLMFCSGIFWDVNAIADPDMRNAVLLFNPLALIIDCYRQVLLFGQIIDWWSCLPAFAIGVVFSIVGFGSLERFNGWLTRRIYM
ncbi:ABC transporter permease [Shewanella waksmanii]|uniref:ABC transporter permease n=1 Tax=Shewanella waksmanii TaxID=213783 RepID=UPI003735BFA6